MADGLTFKMVTEPFHKGIVERQVRMRRAAMWTVREGGRVVAREARANAPVLGAGSGAIKYRAWKSSGAGGTGPVAGLLRNSIRPSKRLQASGAGWSLKVGPRGQRVHLYAGKQEERARYMAAGYAAAEEMMLLAGTEAYGRVWRGI